MTTFAAMGQRILQIKMPAGYNDWMLNKAIEKQLDTTDFTFKIENKSLDARKRNDIHWEIKIVVSSEAIKETLDNKIKDLDIPYSKRDTKVVIVGSGPAGFFAAYVLQKAGFSTTIIERGSNVTKRSSDIDNFEKTGIFNSKSNYAFGEGGAGTFSDGKLTSRSKRISLEKNFILNTYVDAGAPDEILYMTHPHLGSDNLKIIVENLRNRYIDLGGEILFETQLEDIKISAGKVTKIITSAGELEADFFMIAPGHSAYDTYRMLIRNGVGFHGKNLAIGSRIEHHQELINMSRWGIKHIPGVKAAEYRLTSKGNGKENIYSFCMCPGGMVVPASAVAESNIVNGMSLYQRDNKFANAGCVASISLENILGKEVSAMESLEWMEQLENSFYTYAKGYKAPICSIDDFINKKISTPPKNTSYPLGVIHAPLWELLPDKVEMALRNGLRDFSRKIRGFETGQIMGLESKTSAPIQVDRSKNGLCNGLQNLFVIGEGSGYAGGIISSAADGVKVAMNIVNNQYST